MITPPDSKFGGSAGPFAWNGTDNLVGLNVSIAAADAKPFSVEQLDLVSWASPNIYVNLVGFKSDGSYVTARITNASANEDVTNNFVMHTLPGFSDLTLLNLLTSQSWFALDNIVVTSSADARANDVPEPTSLAMLGIGLAAVAAVAAVRRRAK
jgi:hypothetical protein